MDPKYRKTFFAFLIIFPVFLYILMVASFSTNIPVWDDYNVFLEYFTGSGQDRLDLLFTQHNEHRIVFTRAVAEGVYRLLGYIDLRILIFIGNLSLLFIFLMLYYIFRKSPLEAKFFLPVPVFLFLFPQWENAVWAVAALQNYSVIAFAIASFLLFEKKTVPSFIASIIFAVCAVLTSGTGILVFIALIVWALFSRPHSLSRTASAILVFMLTAYIYFKGYIKPPHHPGMGEALLHPARTIIYFFSFIGSSMPFQLFTIVAGAASTAGYIYITARRYYAKNPPVYFSLLFLFLNAAAAALSRSGFGASQAISCRYTIISMLILIFLYFAILEINYASKHFRAFIHRTQYAFIALLIFAGISSYVIQIKILSAKQNERIYELYRWRVSGQGKLDHWDQEYAGETINKAREKGCYRLPEYLRGKN